MFTIPGCFKANHMNYNLLFLTMGTAAVNWVASAKDWKKLVYITKPGTMLVLLAWLWQVSHFQGTMIWFAAALIFSLAGDVFLMLPREQFIAGLISFLLGHIAYTIGLMPTLPKINLASFFVALLVGITALRLYRRIAAGLNASGQQKMKIPVLIYTLAIGVMVTAALLTMVMPSWNTLASLVTSTGAIFFLISDSLLAWDRFVAPIKNRNLTVMATNHLGQIGLVFGAVLNFIVA